MIQQQKKEIFGIIRRLKNRDFSGNTGIAVKNSIFNFGSSFVLKLGSILFTIILARMLLPELFGLYSLALSTIIFFTAFSDLGISTVIIHYISKELAKKKSNAKAYADYLFKLKMVLSFGISVIFSLLSFFIANNYYNKPIFFALLAGSLYIFLNGILSYYLSIFIAHNKFQVSMYKEAIFQISRLILVPLSILITLSKSSEIVLLGIFISLSISYLVCLIYLFFKRPELGFLRDLNQLEKSKVNKFILPMTATIISGIFFGYIDMIILGRFVESAFIGYYSAALSLISSAGVFIGFSGALFPIFARLKGKELSIALAKSRKYTLLISFFAFIITLVLSKYIIYLVYGPSYSLSIGVLQVLAFLLLFDPVISIYSSYYISQGNANFIAKFLIVSTLINISLNLIFISYLIQFSHFYAILGAGIATIIARGSYLLVLIWKNK